MISELYPLCFTYNQQSNPGITVIKYSVTLMTEHDNQQSNPGITVIKYSVTLMTEHDNQQSNVMPDYFVDCHALSSESHYIL
jgi:hypothetical protein